MNESIVHRLQLKKHTDRLILNKPENIHHFDTLLPYDAAEKKEAYDLIVAFVFSLDQFMKNLQHVIDKKLLKPNGALFFAYPKKGNKEYKEYIGRDDFFECVEVDNDGYVKSSQLKFFKMVALNDTFTVIGLKHEVIRKSRANQLSQCVSDYIDRIPDLQKYFAEENDILTFFNNLTPGYQRGWARFVYSTR
ncbi:hypothetical protein M2451_003187 [Dysgonomonas sp. PFB1-18]|uniref:YdeI/OmpD-associated family protein n=1 Tax=unclassified Dysgonomonas TaxID=2630389 RepID=UPI0024744C72|nr:MULTISPECIES: YdeI/OmpD-associated family protein [unclassified Dysgonomonas]MDH6310222.1 hypothetical protein [Dysgonomonas sp. PF1-14]MDH6340041.1 hypothetical protein [Dysgonomonas sp. PF1-16]MDH6381852.1 hypothetical protein [Dysgonomonas sp. PFB1-18]MDH6398906.1 hypothetical protein [Dysgonomonas sp. PF1-23]